MADTFNQGMNTMKTSLPPYTTGRLICGLLGLLAALPVQAQTWPTRTVTVVLPYAAGGPTDVPMRLIAQKMSDDLGQSVVV